MRNARRACIAAGLALFASLCGGAGRTQPAAPAPSSGARIYAYLQGIDPESLLPPTPKLNPCASKAETEDLTNTVTNWRYEFRLLVQRLTDFFRAYDDEYEQLAKDEAVLEKAQSALADAVLTAGVASRSTAAAAAKDADAVKKAQSEADAAQKAVDADQKDIDQLATSQQAIDISTMIDNIRNLRTIFTAAQAAVSRAACPPALMQSSGPMPPKGAGSEPVNVVPVIGDLGEPAAPAPKPSPSPTPTPTPSPSPGGAAGGSQSSVIQGSVEDQSVMVAHTANAPPRAKPNPAGDDSSPGAP